MARKRKAASTTRRLHRSLGVVAAFFIFFLVVSGLGINHAAVLGLEKQHVSQSFLLDWYGIGKPGDIRSFIADGHWVSFAGSGLYLDGNFVSTLSNGVGVLFNGDMLIAAGSDELLLFDREGALIERMPWAQRDSGKIDSIGLLENGIVAVGAGKDLWLADAQLLQWRPADHTDGSPLSSEPTPAPDEVQQAILRHYRGDGLNLERLLLDLHSGRFFGPVGVLIYDLLALAVGFLAVSGLVLWVRGRSNGKKRRRK